MWYCKVFNTGMDLNLNRVAEGVSSSVLMMNFFFFSEALDAALQNMEKGSFNEITNGSVEILRAAKFFLAQL